MWRLVKASERGLYFVRDEKGPYPGYPTALYVYKVREPKTNWEGYMFVLYPHGCAESACALHLLTEATDEDLPTWIREFQKLVDEYYYIDPEKFYEELEKSDIYMPEPDELENYKIINIPRRVLKNVVKIRKIKA